MMTIDDEEGGGFADDDVIKNRQFFRDFLGFSKEFNFLIFHDFNQNCQGKKDSCHVKFK